MKGAWAGPLVLLAASAGGSPSDPPRGEEPRVLSWEDCVAVAAADNPDLASSVRAMEASRASWRGSFNGLLPRATLSNGFSEASGSAVSWQAQAGASLSLFDMGQVASIRSAGAGLSAARAGLRQASTALRFSLRSAFAQLLFAQKNALVSKAILDMRRRSSQLVELRYSSGRESKGNTLRSKAQTAQAEADLAQALRGLRTAQKALGRRLGRDSFAPVAATGTLSAQAPPELPRDLEPLLAVRPDIAAQQALLRGARAALSQARSSLWPTASVNYGRSRLGPTEFPSERYSWTFGGLLSYPLFGGGPTATYFAVQGAMKGVEKSEQDLRAARNQAVVDLEDSWSSFAGGTDQVRVQAALLAAARQRNEEADVRYASGLLTYDGWEIIASDRINTERQAIKAELDAAIAEAAWARATGRTLEE